MMKKILLFATIMTMTMTVCAKEVSQEMAASKAEQLMRNSIDGFSGKVASVKAVTHQGKKAYYVVQFVPQGWALISADDTSTPLIGYSDEGTFMIDGMPETMKVVLDCFAKRITERAQKINTKSAGWDNGSIARRASNESVAPLIQVKWNQSGDYKKYCPKDANGQAIVGCVAVAMAQAMSVAQWPARPSGEHSYVSSTYGTQYINYDKEPAYDWNYIISGNDNKDGAARLLWHCGVAVNMNYGVNGSGTQDSYIVSALQRNFSYPQSVKYYKRSNFSDDEWHELIYNELKNGRAVCLSGQDLKAGYGHCFNLDGYQNGAYHVNWGWGGSNNGYFELTSLKDATMGMDYSAPAYQSVIVGIRKPSDKPSDIILSNNTVKANMPAGTIVGDITVENEATTPPTYTYSILGEYSIMQHQRLPAPFEVKDGQLVTTEELNSNKGSRNITITATDQKGFSISKDFTIIILSSSGVTISESQEVYQSADYYDLSGKKLDSSQPGVNIVRYTSNNGITRTIKYKN